MNQTHDTNDGQLAFVRRYKPSNLRDSQIFKGSNHREKSHQITDYGQFMRFTPRCPAEKFGPDGPASWTVIYNEFNV